MAEALEKARKQYLAADDPTKKARAKKRLEELKEISKTLIF